MVIVGVLFIACGSATPTAPGPVVDPPPRVAAASVSVAAVTAVTEQSSGIYRYGVTVSVAETGGQSAAIISSVTLLFANATRNGNSAMITDAFNPAQIPARGSATSRRINISDDAATATSLMNSVRATVNYTDANGTADSVTSTSFTIDPPSTGCTYSVTPTSQPFAAAGGNGKVTVTASPSGCTGTWTARSNATYITLTGPTQGTSGAQVTYTVSANTSSTSRTGTLNVAGTTVSINQQGNAASNRFDGTYDFSFDYPNINPPHNILTKTLNRYFVVRNGIISSPDGLLTGKVVDTGLGTTTAGQATFESVCPFGQIDNAVYSGTLNSITIGTGLGTYRCGDSSAFNWRVLNGR